MAALTSPVSAGSEEDALQVVEKWAAAFNASDVDAIVALYAPDAMFLGTGSRTVVLRRQSTFERPHDRAGALESRSVIVSTMPLSSPDWTTRCSRRQDITSPGA